MKLRLPGWPGKPVFLFFPPVPQEAGQAGGVQFQIFADFLQGIRMFLKGSLDRFISFLFDRITLSGHNSSGVAPRLQIALWGREFANFGPGNLFCSLIQP